MTKKKSKSRAPALPEAVAWADKAQQTLDAVAARLRAGASYEDEIGALDAALGTGMEDRDREAERDWVAGQDDE